MPLAYITSLAVLSVASFVDSDRPPEQRTCGFGSPPYATRSFLARGFPLAGPTAPPDTMGAAGSTRLIVTLNTEVAVQSKSGNTESSETLSDFWAAGLAVADPHIVYDPSENRWYAVVVSFHNRFMYLGVSKSSDPEDGFDIYTYDADTTPNCAPKCNLADFPAIGFNESWIVVTVNMVATFPGDYLAPRTNTTRFPAYR